MNCVRSASFSILINGSPRPSFTPQSGLQQGDPLSLYLFVICAQILSSKLEESEMEEVIQGLRVCRIALRVNHLFFQDDSLIFSRAIRADSKKIMEILQVYESASGQKVNSQKSAIFFSPNVSDHMREELMEICHISIVALSEKYLGLPTMISRSKNHSSQTLKDRIWKRVQGQKERCLSTGRKEILIKGWHKQSLPT